LKRSLGGLPRRKQRQIDDKLPKSAEVLNVANSEIMYIGLVTHRKHAQSLIIGSAEVDTASSDRNLWVNLPELNN